MIKYNHFLMKILLISLILIFTFDLSARQTTELTFSYWNKPDINIFYSTPQSIDQNTTILFLIHGDTRAAEQYINDWITLAKGRNVVLVAPMFSKTYFREYAFLMMSTENGKFLDNKSLHINDSLGVIFDFFKAKLKISIPSYRLYGHSAGSQFVQNYLLLSEETRIDKAAMANNDFYTFIDDNISYPFGIKNIDISDTRLEWFLRLKAGIFLGEADNNSKDKSLSKIRKARKQGKHRYERGKNFFDDLVKFGVDNNLPLRWRYHIVPGVGHDNKEMSLAASEFLLEDL
ncbi:MAG: hypothetical protein CMD68_00935 [Gammaproteobacteria bacterium]|nr:hypothetical protein [Gammaproteobacteria bacterium]